MFGLIEYSHSDPFRSAGGLSASPKELKKQLLEGTLDAAFISASAYLDNRDTLDALPLGIAAKCKAHSVLLFPGPESLSPASETSIILLRVLSHHFWKRPITGKLVIGDEALSCSGPCLDLGEEWHKATGLPFLFALLAKRKERPFAHAPLVKALESYPQSAYHRAFDYHLTDQHFTSLELFHELRQNLP